MLLFHLNADHLDRLSAISADIGVIALASVAIPALLDRFDTFIAMVGAFAMVFFWAVSLVILSVKPVLLK